MADKTEAKRLARIMAVQAVYSWDATGNPAWTKEDITPDMAAFYREQAGYESGIENFVKEDRKLFRAIAAGVIEQVAALDELINPLLEKEELSMTLRAILRGAVFEVIHLQTPKGVVVKEYSLVTELLAQERDVGFVQAVVNKVGA